MSGLRARMELAGLLALLLVIWIGADAGFLVVRPLWMDEVHTWLIVTDDDVPHAMRALADGVDFNPPAYYLVARLLRWLPGELTELRLRALSVVFMVSSLVACFLLLRRRFSLPPSMAATLLIASSPVIIHQCAEARFYSMWLASICWLALLLDKPWQSYVRLHFVLCCVLAVLICTCHYFGILSLLLLLTGQWLFSVHPPGHGIRLLFAVGVAGSMAVSACLPILAGQRLALTRPTWISPPTWSSSLEFLVTTLRPGLLILIWLATVIVRRTRGNDCLAESECPDSTVKAHEEVVVRPRCVAAAVASLMLMPLALVAISWIIQPAMVSRYAIVGVMGLAPIFASLVGRLSINLQRIAIVAASAWCLTSVRECVWQWRKIADQTYQLEAMIDQQTTDTVFVFEDRITWQPLVHRRPDLSSRCLLADFLNEELAADSSLRIVQRDVGRRISKWYPQYQMVPISYLTKWDAFVVVPYAGGACDDLRYPEGFENEKLGSIAFRFRNRRTAELAGAANRSNRFSGF